MTNNLKIELIQNADAPAVLNIYKHYVENTIVSFEYEVPSLDVFSERIKTNTVSYPWLVCRHGDQLIGYAYGSTHRYRTAYQWSPESTIYLAPDFHSKGVGRILYETLFALLRLQGYFNVFAGVGLPNDKSVGFHRALGFEEIGIFKKVGYKLGNWHDTHWFQLALQTHVLNPANPETMAVLQQTDGFKSVMAHANQQLANKTTF